MSRITWDALGERLYEVGLDHGVLYLPDSTDDFTNGIPWNGLTKVTDPVLQRNSNGLYSGNYKVRNAYDPGEYTGTIEAFTYPDEFEQCIGSEEYYPGVFFTRQGITRFGLSYRSLVGNDSEGLDRGYKIHLLYNLEIVKHDRTYTSINDSIDPSPLTWDYESFPHFPEDSDRDPVYHIVMDSTKLPKMYMQHLEEVLYGTASTVPRLPTPDEISEEYYYYYNIWRGYPGLALYIGDALYPSLPEKDYIYG